jgi:hypothetical protein
MIKGGRPLPGKVAAVRREIVDGNIAGAQNLMATWNCLDWRPEEAMIEEQQRKAVIYDNAA